MSDFAPLCLSKDFVTLKIEMVGYRMRIVISTILLSVVLALMLPVSVALSDDCPSYNDPHDKFSLGPVPLGTFKSTEVKGILPSEAIATCEDVDCIIDGVGQAAGLLYYVGVYFPDNPGTIMLESVQLQDGATYKGHLIAGIQIGDSVDAVQKKLKSMPKSFPSWRFYDYANAKWLTMKACLRGSRGVASVYKLDFDETGKLVGVELTAHGADLGD